MGLKIRKNSSLLSQMDLIFLKKEPLKASEESKRWLQLPDEDFVC